MEYYFKVVLDYNPQEVMLVKAKDVIEAGEKVAKTYIDGYWDSPYESVIEITRTNITKVIE